MNNINDDCKSTSQFLLNAPQPNLLFPIKLKKRPLVAVKYLCRDMQMCANVHRGAPQFPLAWNQWK